jgi:hypothetical protein
MTDPELNITRSLIRLGRRVQVVRTVYDLLDWHTGGENFWRKWRMYATGCVESGIQFGGVVAVTKEESSDSQRLGTNLLWTRASEPRTVEWNVPSRAYIACQPGAADSTFVPHALCNAFVRTVEVIQCIFLPNGLGTYSVCWSAILTMARVGHSQLHCFRSNCQGNTVYIFCRTV